MKKSVSSGLRRKLMASAAGAGALARRALDDIGEMDGARQVDESAEEQDQHDRGERELDQRLAAHGASHSELVH